MSQYKILGVLEVLDDRLPRTPTSPKVRGLLALLLARANQVVTVEAIVEELWGSDPPDSAVHTVQTYVYHLRRQLADEHAGHGLATTPGGYVLRVEPDEVDATVFERRVRTGRAHLEENRPDEAARVLRAALHLWTGPALAGVPHGRALQAHATHLEQLRTAALELRIRADVALGRQDELIPELGSLVRTHPLNEWFHGQLIAALSRSGRRGEALQAYQEVRAVLRDELGVHPSMALQRLQHQILTDGAAAVP
jgi:DNA-binding SARP family transcriptional activator